MTVTHVGSTKKYAESWETIFSGRKSAKQSFSGAASNKKKTAKAKKAKRQSGRHST